MTNLHLELLLLPYYAELTKRVRAKNIFILSSLRVALQVICLWLLSLQLCHQLCHQLRL